MFLQDFKGTPLFPRWSTLRGTLIFPHLSHREPRAAGEPQPAIGVERIVSTLSARRVVNDRSRRRRQAVGHLCTMAAGDAIVNVDEGHHRAADGNSGTTDGEHESWELRPGQEGTILQLEVRGGGQDVSQRNGSQDALFFFNSVCEREK